jgi:hypothetical protein
MRHHADQRAIGRILQPLRTLHAHQLRDGGGAALVQHRVIGDRACEVAEARAPDPRVPRRFAVRETRPQVCQRNPPTPRQCPPQQITAPAAGARARRRRPAGGPVDRGDPGAAQRPQTVLAQASHGITALFERWVRRYSTRYRSQRAHPSVYSTLPS